MSRARLVRAGHLGVCSGGNKGAGGGAGEMVATAFVPLGAQFAEATESQMDEGRSQLLPPSSPPTATALAAPML